MLKSVVDDMSKPWIHSQSSVTKFGGKPEDYIEIHEFLDSSKGAVPDNRHRIATHNAWFIMEVLPRVKFSNSCQPAPDNKFHTIINSDGNHVSIRDIGEQHVSEDFGDRFVPSLQDYVAHLEAAPWMSNVPNSVPSSNVKVQNYTTQYMDGSNLDFRKYQFPTLNLDYNVIARTD